MKKRRVALCGDNLVLSVIGACLQKDPAFQVQKIQDMSQVSGNAKLPDVILFEFHTVKPDSVLTLMRDYPTVMLLGVDLTKSQMVVLTGSSFRLLTIDDLIKAINKKFSLEIIQFDKYPDFKRREL